MSRRKHPRDRRRPRANRKNVKALATAAAMAGGTQAYADAVRFENNGEFEWSRCRETIALDITLPAGAQDGIDSRSSIDLFSTCHDCDYYRTIRLYAPDGGFVGASDSGCYYYCVFPPPRPFRLPEGAWIQREIRGGKGWRGSPVNFYCQDSGCGRRCAHWPSGAVGFIGFRFTVDHRVHYGWIHAALSNPREPHLEALAWGYETEPDTRIKAGEGAAPCSENTTFKLSCKSARTGPALKAVVKKSTPGLFATFRLDGDPDKDQQVRVRNGGRAKVTFKRIPPGEHTVDLLQCELSESAECVPVEPPPNDLCEDAMELAVPSETEGWTRGASIDEGFPACGQGTEVIVPGVWYRVVGTGGRTQADTCAEANFNTKINVYRDGCDEPVCVVGNNNSCEERSAVVWDSVEGATYWILVHGTLNEVGEFVLSVTDAEGEINCERVEQLELNCQQESSRLTATLDTSLPEGAILHLTLDDAVTREVRVGNRGRAEAVFENLEPGMHRVCVDECPVVCRSVDCP